MKYQNNRYQDSCRLAMYGSDIMEEWITFTYYKMNINLTDMVWEPSPKTTFFTASTWTNDYFLYLYNKVGKDFKWWYCNYMDTQELTDYLDINNNKTFYTLLDNGEPSGFAIVKYDDSWDCNLEYFGLMPQSMGKGLGTKFLLDVMQQTRLTRKNMWLYTTSLDGSAALPNYQKCGFKIVEKKIVQEYYPIHTLQKC